jgi:hypothetical protein
LASQQLAPTFVQQSLPVFVVSQQGEPSKQQAEPGAQQSSELSQQGEPSKQHAAPSVQQLLALVGESLKPTAIATNNIAKIPKVFVIMIFSFVKTIPFDAV